MDTVTRKLTNALLTQGDAFAALAQQLVADNEAMAAQAQSAEQRADGLNAEVIVLRAEAERLAKLPPAPCTKCMLAQGCNGLQLTCPCFAAAP